MASRGGGRTAGQSRKLLGRAAAVLRHGIRVTSRSESPRVRDCTLLKRDPNTSAHLTTDPEHLWHAREEIVLMPHDPSWIKVAADECRQIALGCDARIPRAEHIGSRSFSGLIAQLVVDRMPLLRTFEPGFAWIELMRALGYWYAGDFGIPGQHLFVRGLPRTHHAHMLVDSSKKAIRHLAVRDMLRADLDAAARFVALNQGLEPRLGYPKPYRCQHAVAAHNRASGTISRS